MSLQLIRPNESHEAKYLATLAEWEKSGEEIMPGAMEPEATYTAWLEKKHLWNKVETCPPGIVPSTCFFMMVDDTMVGALDFRHTLNDHMLKFGGHIGYGVLPRFRRLGYASAALHLAMSYAKELNLNRVLVTCKKQNIASAKTILSCGGVLENEVHDGENWMQRYWIEV